ncbi:TPA: cystathionine gamma-synthase [Streptococcus pneumoniae]|nr:cystathionine gamma-synthase [Streptococcus pneumoniae]HET5711600.1 cystathionine gamma-synthase [Streptococcus pneumoniae]HET5856387.1 cystathionine gamma-synthase [Streptococcus pneumoniae]HET5862431.1 cystathionine gamma-synthase [Streptococcus pneumoniae]HET5902502.1 cystathionine gamma-synthase [Streptococcus pneumoniae]
MKQERFPLVSDDEVMLTEMPVMNLYDESDLISNIKGEYRDKNYLEWAPITEEKPVKPIEKQVEKSKKAPLGVKKEGKSYAEVAREEARADLKKKRSANYLTQDFSLARRHSQPSLVRQGNQPTAPFQKENPGEFVKYSQKLTQSHYILAEEVHSIPTKNEEVSAPAPKKNNYDFLKKSQIYNKKSKQTEQERRVAQELNLTRMTE